MGLQEALDTVRPNERVMYRNGKAYMHFQYFLFDNGQTQLNVWYRVVDETGHEQLAGERHTNANNDQLVTIYEEMLRNADIDPGDYRIIPIPPRVGKAATRPVRMRLSSKLYTACLWWREWGAGR